MPEADSADSVDGEFGMAHAIRTSAPLSIRISNARCALGPIQLPERPIHVRKQRLDESINMMFGAINLKWCEKLDVWIVFWCGKSCK